MRQRTPWEQLDYERRTAERDKRSLSETAWKLASSARLAKATIPQLQAAAALAGHEGELGFAGRAAQAELKRRGL